MLSANFESKTGNMDINEFCTHIKSRIQYRLGRKFQVVIQKLVKNNDVTLYELIIAEQGCNNPKLVCLNCYYRKYQKDKNLNAIEADIVDIYLNL